MRAYVVDSEHMRYGEVEIENSLDAFYKTIGCDCIDIVIRSIGGRHYNIIVDDEGLLKPNYTNGVCSNAEEILAGAIIICAMNPEDHDLGSLEEDDRLIIEDNIVTAIFGDGSARKVLRYQV